MTRDARPLNRAFAYLLAVWMTHGLLRAALLYRRDAYGFPFVGKPDWYIFHALAIDLLWILGFSLPALTVLAIAAAGGGRAARVGGKAGSGAKVQRLAVRGALLALGVFHSTVLLFTVVDHETLRFLGMHLDPSLLGTYGNGAALREVFKFLASDLSVPYLPYLLFLGCVPFSLVLTVALVRAFRWARQEKLAPSVPIAWIVAAVVSHVFLTYVWPGGFRMRKLRPVTASVMESFSRQRPVNQPAIDLARLRSGFQRQWLSEQGDSAYVFPDSLRPFYKVPLSRFCGEAAARNAGGDGSRTDARCGRDGDGDGFLPAGDCDDGDARAHPGAEDLPGDGVDQDCDGTDSRPVNLVFVILESHRAVNVGYLRSYGAAADATPFLDSLAAQSHIWTRFHTTGVPTINALVTTHLSILQHPTRYIANEFTTLRHRAFSDLLGRHGYHTHFFSAADPAWDGQVPWLRQWYQGVTYSRDRETDGAMFDHMGRWMLDSLGTDRPFLMTCITKTNHYPFNSEPGVRGLPPGAGLQERMIATMEYTDACLRRFMDTVRGAPWFGNTLFIIMADHGFPLSEHGSSTIGYGLYTESTWIPFLIYGQHHKLGPPAVHPYPAAQMDVGPTLLDLAGIREPDHYLGHSLLRPAGRHSRIYMVRGEQGMVEQDGYRVHGPLGEAPREQGPEVFHVAEDPLEKRNLYPGTAAPYDSLLPFLRDMGTLNTRLVEDNALWPDSLGIFPGVHPRAAR